ncbi:MAG: DUF1269 domain-containing protein [Thermomicrobiales bacterium]|nr:DUF1269 domain-containing protein [Thermomicrobiales bacterium]
MSTLTVVKFATPAGADQALAKLDDLQKQNLVRVLDAAIVSWPSGSKKPSTRQIHSTTGAGAMSGAFWGFLFGLIFFVPLLGAAIGAAMGAVSGSLVDVGINDDFIKKTREQITEGTSALFLLSEAAVRERIAESFKDLPPYELIASNLTADEEAKLKEIFAA